MTNCKSLHFTSTPNSLSRIVWIDVARAVAILMVLLIHSLDGIYESCLYGGQPIDTVTNIFITTFYTLGRLGVPLFLFISGALLLNKNFTDKKNIVQFYKKNYLNLLICFLIWIVIYNILIPIIRNESFSIKKMLLELLFLRTNDLSHMWYMYVILGIYIIIPFLSVVLNKFPKSAIFPVMLLITFNTMILPNTSSLLKVFGIDLPSNIVLDINGVGSYYTIYLITGFYLYNGVFKSIKTSYISFLGIVFFIGSIFVQVLTSHGGQRHNIWYDFIGLYLCSICVFELFSRISLKNKYTILLTNELSKRALAIYFIHIPIIFLLKRTGFFQNIPRSIGFFILFIVTLMLSLLLINFLCKIKTIRKWVLMM